MKLSDLLEQKRKEKAKKEKVKNTKIATTGVILGATAGAIGALLFAPKSGKDTRKVIGEKSKQVANSVSEKVKETKGSFGDKINSSKENLKKTFSKKDEVQNETTLLEENNVESEERKDVE
ncbi:YtxH domain-containing protein [Clostridium bornimense]|uniref:YtxH domain-containing protein n=1 Tax=Clostridium bornimense TaxID=1216932 RepID=UPI001C1060FC|nr:YtxH domain-containing protein [Clostridium bornimense]MBU5315338.1 YtxH domain-containing protein [Clostridium bornimense]